MVDFWKFWDGFGRFFRGFGVDTCLFSANALDMLKLRQNIGTNLCFSYVSSTSRMSHTRQKPTQNRSRSLSNRASHKDRAKNPVWDSPGSILDGSGALLGASWASLGRLWAALGWLLASLGRFLGVSWALLGRSWASLGWSETPLGCILPPQDAPDLDFERFGNVPGIVLKGFGDMFWHALACSTHFVT